MRPNRGNRFSGRTIAVFGINLIFLIAIAVWLSLHIDLGILESRVRRIPVGPFIAAAGINAISNLASGFRASMLLRTNASAGCAITYVGLGLNAVLPFRLGDASKLAFAKMRYGIDAYRATTAVVFEKFLDVAALVSLAMTLFLIAGDSRLGASLLKRAMLVAAALLATVALLVVAYRVGRSRIAWLHQAWPKIASHTFGQDVGLLVLVTLAIWTLNVCGAAVAFSAISRNSTFGLADAVSLVVITSLAVSLPTAPAGLGIFEAGIVAFLVSTDSTETELALAAALVFHLAHALPQIGIAGCILAFGLRGKSE